MEFIGKNYSYKDFSGIDISGNRYVRCNFSHATNIDKASANGTEFIECNFTKADLPKAGMTKCNLRRLDTMPTKEMI